MFWYLYRLSIIIYMIHLIDPDPRQFSDTENYQFNHGSLSSVIINLNKELEKLVKILLN